MSGQSTQTDKNLTATHPGLIPKARRPGTAFLGGWYFTGDENSRNRLWHLIFSNTSAVTAHLVNGNFYTGLMLLLNADDSFIGLMGMIAFASNLLQCLIPLFLERFSRRRYLIIGLRSIMLFIQIVFIGMIPYFDVDRQWRLTLFALGTLLVQLLAAIAAPGLSIWHIQFLPQEVRLSYFSRLYLTNGIVAALVSLTGSAVVDLMKERGNELAGLTILRMLAFLAACLNIYTLCRMKEYPYSRAEKRFTFRELLISPFRERRYLHSVAIAFLWNLVFNIPGSYYTVYLLRNLGVGYSFIMLVNSLNVPILLLLTPAWERILRRFSWLKALNAAVALYVPHFLLLGLITHSSVYYLYPLALIYSFVLTVGINLCLANIPYLNIPDKNQTVFVGFQATAVNLGAFLGAAAGRELVKLLHPVRLHLPGLDLIDKQLLMLITGCAMALASLAILFLRRNIPEST